MITATALSCGFPFIDMIPSSFAMDVQYKESVFAKVREWLEENGYPAVIEYQLANGNVNGCKVIYNF